MSPKKYLIAAGPAILTIAIGWLTPLIATGRFENTFAFDGGRVPDADGVCCVEPTYYFIARAAAQLSPFIVAGCLVWMAIIWLRSRRR